MEAIVKTIISSMDSFKENSAKFIAGNKAAGARARKVSLELDKLLKDFRRESVKETKKA